MADAAIHLGRAKQASNYLLLSPTKNAHIDYLSGFTSLLKKNHQQALLHMEDALIKEPRHFGAYVARAALKIYLGKKINTKKELKLGWNKGLDLMIHFLRGSTAASEGDWSSAEKHWTLSEGVCLWVLYFWFKYRAITEGCK